ncbi:MAG: ribonuclease E/G [Lachnospiraceae bacterium]|nr:ribonuclease E/G [Lachnospiraceae bacterium]
MMKKYVLTKINNLMMGFLFEEGKVSEIRCYEEDSILGNIYVGRVSNIVKNINAAFVDIKKGLSCYYPLEEYTGNSLKIGDLLTVQINKEPIKTKQPSVTTKLSMAGEYILVHQDDTVGVSAKIGGASERDRLKDIVGKAIADFKVKQKSGDTVYGGIIRTKASGVSENDLYNETISLLCKLDEAIYKSKYATGYSCVYEKMPAYLTDIDELSKINDKPSGSLNDEVSSLDNDTVEIITDIEEVIDKCREHSVSEPKLYNDSMISVKAFYGLDTIVEKALNKKVYLKSGAYLIIEPTEARTVIDVNSGKAIKGSVKEDKILAINEEAAKEIGRQLRLRNISGIVIVDFISMKNSHYNELLLNTLKEAVYKDSVSTIVVDMTKLGLVELTRKRIRRPIVEILSHTGS